MIKKTDIFEDERGKLIFAIKENSYDFKQCVISINKKNTFRGIHINQFDKLITCIKGKIIDILINFDEKADDYLIPKYYNIDSLLNNQLLIPKNYGHGFLSLEEETIIQYHFNDLFTDENTLFINYLDPLLDIKLPLPFENLIMSKKDIHSKFLEPIEYMVFGKSGFIGSHIIKYLNQKKKKFINCNLRLEKIQDIEKFIDIYKPKYIINCAGLTGIPNISWCDYNKNKTIETNIIFQMTLVKICNDKNIHLTIIGSGGIFKHDKIYSEDDEGNYFDNFYSICRINLENMVKHYNNVLYVRINYPIANEGSSKNTLTKILKYEKIDNVNLSITYLDELLPILINEIENNAIGICNLVNKGSIYLTEIINIFNKNNKLNLFKEYTINNNENSNKSSSKLSIEKLNKYNIMDIKDAVKECVMNYVPEPTGNK